LSVLDRINLFIEIYFRIIKRLKSVKLITPFLILSIFQGLWLTILVYFYYAPVNKLFSPLLSYFYSERVLHFPYFYYLLPQIYNYGSLLILDFIFGIVLCGAAVFMIGADFKQEKGGLVEGIRTAFKSLLALMVIWILKNGIGYAFLQVWRTHSISLRQRFAHALFLYFLFYSGNCDNNFSIFNICLSSGNITPYETFPCLMEKRCINI